MANIGKWYTFTEYYNEEGIQISKKEAKKNYLIGGRTINTEINGNTGIKKIWYTCRRNKQLKIEF